MAKKTSPLAGKINRNVFFHTSLDLPRIIEIDLKNLRENPDQPRKVFDETALQELADSIEQHELIQPIAVAPDPENEDGYIVVAGERRFRAFKQLGRETIPAIVTQGNHDEIALIENLQRVDLNPLEEAEALEQIMDRYDYTQIELSKVIGKARNTVNELLRLNTLPQEIKEEYRSRTSDSVVSKSVLIELTRIKNKDKQLKLWEELKAGATVRVARKAKREGTANKMSSSPAMQLLSAGRRFTKKLEGIAAHDLNNEQFSTLLELREKIDNLINTLEEKGDRRF
ncbi:parB-like partition protein (plasmid) [Nitrosococcus halophilus Nc 4]|uniref:Probable chromosome-partitioning protein ParB n=1 Tax=Nitrosococcus halophilus (strain Nc4) TaxID=472759 RepID=D5C5F9_NITHN|nr:ParB/RepB/Spo0J family partition protein [Nitrosococcus halophilus]ADE17013.1 parB-like partition protein [Nitrosococcus halophilus Nc 4]